MPHAVSVPPPKRTTPQAAAAATALPAAAVGTVSTPKVKPMVPFKKATSAALGKSTTTKDFKFRGGKPCKASSTTSTIMPTPPPPPQPSAAPCHHNILPSPPHQLSCSSGSGYGPQGATASSATPQSGIPPPVIESYSTRSVSGNDSDIDLVYHKDTKEVVFSQDATVTDFSLPEDDDLITQAWAISSYM